MTAQTPSPIFQFHSRQIRTTIIDDQPWFVAKDVCAALNITWSGATNRAIPNAWRSMLKLNMEGFPSRTVSIISEPAVYKLAFRSNKPEADAFTNWVASEVLPSIRKTGKYEAKPKQKALPAPKPSLPVIEPSLRAEWLQAYGDLCKASRAWETANDTFWQLTNRMRNDEFRRESLSRFYKALDLLSDTLWMQNRMGFTVDRAMQSAKELAADLK